MHTTPDPVDAVMNSAALGIEADGRPVTPASMYHALSVWFDWFGDRTDDVAIMLRPRIALALTRCDPHLI